MASNPSESNSAPPQPYYWPTKTGPLDIVVASLIGVGAVAMLAGNIVILCNRTYKPIKVKSVPLTLLSSLGGLVWIVAALVVNDHFPRKRGSGLDICSLWTYWLQALGFSVWLNCLTLRLIALYRIIICKRGIRAYYLLLIPLLFPAVAFCIAASVLHQLKYKRPPAPAPPTDAVGDCQFDEKKRFLAFLLILLMVIYFLVFLGFTFILRNSMAQFNEFRLTRRGGILSLFLFLLSLATLSSHTYDKAVGRCLLSSAVASTIFYYFWARNGIVIYNVLFNQADYLEKFYRDLRRLPSQHERDKSSASFLKMEAQLTDIRAEVAKHLDEIRELEDEVTALECVYATMQQTRLSQECGTPLLR